MRMSASGGSESDKPTGSDAAETTGLGAWPETHESVFTGRAARHGEKLASPGNAVEGWTARQVSTFNGSHVWSGPGSNAAGNKVGNQTSAMEGHQQQFRDAGAWCNEAAGHVGAVKETIRSRTRRLGLMARVAPSGAGSGGGASQMQQVMSMPMQMAQQARKMAGQVAKCVGQLPQGIMQGVQGGVQQIGQMTGGAGQSGEGWISPRRTSVSSSLRPRVPRLAQANLESGAVQDAAPPRHAKSPDAGIVL